MISRVTAKELVHRRYQLLAPVYDWVSAEWPLYAAARARAIELLRLRRGATVLDVACGTGRNFQLIERGVGPSGRVVGVDFTPRMLHRARARIARHGWDNAYLVRSDAAQLSSGRLAELGVLEPDTRFDAALCTLGLSVIPDWEGAWRAMLGLVRPGGRVAVMDGSFPARPGDAGELVALRPFAWLLCRLFAADCRRRPWELVERDTDESTLECFTGGYVAMAAGTAKKGGPG